MATLRRFIALLLVRPMVGARSHRKTGTHFSGSRSKTWNSKGAISAQKGRPAKRTGHTLLVAPQDIQKTLKNNGLFAIWLADFVLKPALLQALWASSVGYTPRSTSSKWLFTDSLQRQARGCRAGADQEQARELLMGERHHAVAVGPLHRRDDPFRGALLDRMDRIAGGRLEYLGQHAIGIAREHVVQRRRFCFRRLQSADMEPHERPAELDHDAGIGRQKPLADDATDGALAADQNGFDVAAVLAGNQEGGK